MAEKSNVKAEPLSMDDVTEEFEFEKTSFSAGENRPTGARARFRIFDTPSMGLAPKLENLDESDIVKIITSWESLHPDEVLENYKIYATQPYATIGPDFAVMVTDDTIEQWFDSKEFQDGMLDFPISNPREVKVTDFSITYLGRTRACVTYRVEEKHTNKRISVGNSAAFMIKTDSGWKITATAQHPNFHDDLEPHARAVKKK